MPTSSRCFSEPARRIVMRRSMSSGGNDPCRASVPPVELKRVALASLAVDHG
jgi:hypothetical protein